MNPDLSPRSPLSRRQIFKGAGAAALAGGLTAYQPTGGSSPAAAASPPSRLLDPLADPLLGENMYRDVITYYSFGEHRTGTVADWRTADWIAEQLHAAGLDVAFQPVTRRQFIVREHSLQIAGESFESFPLWYPRATGPQPIRAPLAVFQAGVDPRTVRDRIAVLNFTKEGGPPRAIAAAVGAGAVAVLGVTPGGLGQRGGSRLQAYNSTLTEPWPVPVLQIGPRDEQPLFDAAKRGAAAVLLVDGWDEPQAKARNVVGRLNRGKEVVVVSTPISGWFTCAGERGPGVALSLGLARWTAQRKTNESYIFTYNTGHEWEYYGAGIFMEHGAPPPDRARTWLHLGASIANYMWEMTDVGWQRQAQLTRNSVTCANAELQTILTQAFDHIPLRPVVSPGAGELIEVVNKGYKAWGMTGGGAGLDFHTPVDRPENTGPELLHPIAYGLSRALQLLEAPRA